MFDPEPEIRISNSNYIRWSEIPVTGTDNKGQNIKKVRVRIMGSTKIPGSLIQCWTAWEEYQEEEDGKMVTKARPHRELFEKGKPCSKYLKELDKDENPKSAWNTIVWNADEERPMVWEITQSTIKDGILSLANNAQWGGKAEDGTLLKDVSRFTIEVSKIGDLKNTSYLVNAEPPAEPPSQEIVDAIKEAMIDVRVLVNGENNGDPFGALSAAANDQEDIKRKSQSVSLGDDEGINKPVSAMDVLGKLRDNAPPGPDQETAPPMGDGEPY